MLVFPAVGVRTMGGRYPLIVSISPARKAAAWRTFRFSAAPTTISAPLPPDTSTMSPAAAGPVRTHDPRTGPAQGSLWATPPAGTSEPASASRPRYFPSRLIRSSSLSRAVRAIPWSRLKPRPGTLPRPRLPLRDLLPQLQRRRPLPPELLIEGRQLGGEHLSPAAHGARHALLLRGKHGARLLGRLAIGALHGGLEPGQLVACGTRRAREAVGQALEGGEGAPRRAIDRAAGEGADLVARTAQAARERALPRHRVPDVEAEPQLGDQRGVGDVDPRIELDPHGPCVRSLPDAEPDFVNPRQDERPLRLGDRSLTGDGGNAVAVARGGRRWVAQVPHEAVQPDIPRRRLEARQPFV